MKGITEDYVSRETYKLLKEKGYNGEFKTCYDMEGYTCSAIHLYDAMKWIREQGFYINIDIDVDYDEDERGTKWYHKPAWDWVVFRIDERKQMSDDGALYATYEQAAEVAIKWCLENLI